MNAADVDGIERALAFRLPAPYREFLLRYPQALVEAREVGDHGLVTSGPSERECYAGVARVIEENRMVRRPGTPWIEERDESWPDRFVVIGDNQCGDYFVVDRESDADAVWMYDHERGEFLPAGEYFDEGSAPLTLARLAARLLSDSQPVPENLEAVRWRLPSLQAALLALDCISGEDLSLEQFVEVNGIAGLYHDPLRIMWRNFSGIAAAEGVATGVLIRRRVREVLTASINDSRHVLAQSSTP
jgi:hypothetical protein